MTWLCLNIIIAINSIANYVTSAAIFFNIFNGCREHWEGQHLLPILNRSCESNDELPCWTAHGSLVQLSDWHGCFTELLKIDCIALLTQTGLTADFLPQTAHFSHFKNNLKFQERICKDDIRGKGFPMQAGKAGFAPLEWRSLKGDLIKLYKIIWGWEKIEKTCSHCG